MKRLLPILSILILAFSALVPMVAAQDTVSAGCTGLGGSITTFPTTITDDFLQSESVSFTFAGAGLFTVNVNGNPELVDAGAGETFNYYIPADGNYTFEITVTGNDGTTSVESDCLGADEEDYPEGMICHRPPGNPENAHTLNVGVPAVQAHLAHGDTEGPCPEETDTFLENFDTNMVVVVRPQEGIIEIFADCGEDTCEDATTIILVDLIDFSLIMDGEGNFILLEEGEEVGFEMADDGAGVSAILYYLHPDPEDSTVGVFQLNIYQDGVLVDDGTLLFITEEGIVVQWTSHSIWDLDDDDDS